MSASDDKGFSDALATLVPQLAVDLARAGDATHVSIDGSMLSADISGFTALSERLAGKGKAGAEEITALINRCFETLIDEAYRYGGEVLKFGGDAILVLFRGDDHEVRAAAAGYDMQRALGESNTAAKAALTMTVGVGEGPFDVFLVGSAPRELLVTGDRATHVIELEAAAGTGQTLISTGIRKALPTRSKVRSVADGFVLKGPIDAPTPGPAAREVSAYELEPLVPAEVLEHFAAFADTGGEHRIAAVGFVKLSGVQERIDADGGEATGEHLGDATEALQSICARYDVTCLHTDIAEDGLKFLLCAGAPVNHGNVDDAMLEAGVEIANISTPFTLKVGVQRGRLFAGFLGSSYRHTYTLMGDVVNTAARMLTAAHRAEVVAVDDVIAAARSIYVTESLEPFTVKGKVKPIEASRVIAATEAIRQQGVGTPIVGREEQLSWLKSVLVDDAVAELVGPAGAGKSKLLEAFRTDAEAAEHPVVSGQCSPYSQSTPYALGRIVLRNVLGIDTFADAQNAGDILLKVIRHAAPTLEPLAPILAIPVGASVPPTAQASAIDPKFLRDQINIQVGDLLAALLPRNTVIVLEDTHWIDDPSAELFRHVLARCGELGWAGVSTRRPGGTWIPIEESELRTVEVEPLTGDDIRQLAVACVETDLTDRQLDAIVEQAEGNPLFAIELARSAGTTESVPESVEQLIGARIDALDPELRHAMRVAAVFGYRLKESDLATMLAPAPAPALHSLEEFVIRERADEVRFTHALYRDVAYEGLPFAERKRMHRRIGEHLEAKHDDHVPLAPVLALHFAEAKDSARTWTYGVLAGDTARQQAATLEAAANYERALKASSHLRDLEPEVIADVALKLGDASSMVGDFPTAERAYRRARTATDDDLAEARAMINIGRLRELQGRYSDAARWYGRVSSSISGGRSVESLRVQSEMHYQIAGLLHRKHDHQGCIVEGRLALGTAEDANDVPAMAAALQRLHLATVFLGRADRIGYGPRALALYRELGEEERIASVLNNLGVECYFKGEWSQAATWYQEAAAAGVRAGSAVDGLLGAVNAGEILSDQGYWDQAIEQFEIARRNWEDGRYPMGLAIAKQFMAIAYGRSGQAKAAEALYEDTIRQFIDMKLHDEAIDTRAHRAEQRAHRGVVDDDLPELLEATEAGTASRHRVLRAVLLSGSGDQEAAIAELSADLETLEGYDRALTLRILGFVAPDTPDQRWAHEAQAMFDSLGVVGLQPLPDRSA